MKKVILTFCLSFSFVFLFSQNNLIVKGKKQRTLETSKWYKINSFTDECDQVILTGKIENFSKDSLMFRAESIEQYRVLTTPGPDGDYKYTSSTGVDRSILINKNNIRDLTIFKSEKSVKNRDNRGGVGTLFVITGLVTAINIFTVKGNNNIRNLTYSAAGQLGLGTAFLISSANKKKVKFEEDGWRFK